MSRVHQSQWHQETTWTCAYAVLWLQCLSIVASHEISYAMRHFNQQNLLGLPSLHGCAARTLVNAPCRHNAAVSGKIAHMQDHVEYRLQLQLKQLLAFAA